MGTSSGGATTVAVGGTGLLFLPPLLMIVFRRRYPRWWFDSNLELLRFANRVGIYFALMDDRYPDRGGAGRAPVLAYRARRLRWLRS